MFLREKFSKLLEKVREPRTHKVQSFAQKEASESRTRRVRSFAPITMMSVLLILSGCYASNPLNDYVEKSFTLSGTDVANAVTEEKDAGTMTFTHRSYYCSSYQKCDTVQCGWDYDRVCSPREICRTTDHGERVCNSYEDCHEERTPRYCDTNCRDIPYLAYSDSKSKMDIMVKINGLSGKEAQDLAYTQLWVGAHTNSKFAKAVKDPTARPAEFKQLFDSVSADDSTVLLLSSKGYRINPAATTMEIKGGALHVSLAVDKATEKKNALSMAGSKVVVPDFMTSNGEDMRCY